MLRKFVIAAAALAAFTGPTLAEGNWVILKSVFPSGQCFVAARAAAPGEQQIAGPFDSQAAAEEAMKANIACAPDNSESEPEPVYT